MSPLNILSIQSHVAYGHVGNSAAVFAMQRLGHEVWPVHTVQFSNHTGYGAWKGRVFEAGLIDECVEGIFERGVLPGCGAVLSGYMGSPDTGAAILRAAARVKAANPKALYCCDPVIGDIGRGIFVRSGVPEFFRAAAVPMADIITPNHFELDYLSGVEGRSMADISRALAIVHKRGPKIILVTSLQSAETPGDAVDIAVSQAGTVWRVRTPRLDISVNGAGDTIAALFLVHFMTTGSAADALSKAASSVYGILKRTRDAASREILLIEAQDELAMPTRRFVAQEL